jgi:hypothetical protein
LTGSHPLLAQIPLTVSPFIQLPTATTLPYTFKTTPSTLPPSSTGAATAEEKPKYVVSGSGHTAHPDDIIESCRSLQAYLKKLQSDADEELKRFEESVKARELAEKRRVAPGWLDSDARILEPSKAGECEHENQASLVDGDVSSAEASRLGAGLVTAPGQEGEELDRAFGGLGL